MNESDRNYYEEGINEPSEKILCFFNMLKLEWELYNAIELGTVDIHVKEDGTFVYVPSKESYKRMNIQPKENDGKTFIQMAVERGHPVNYISDYIQSTAKKEM
jgi:hypothetical protein